MNLTKPNAGMLRKAMGLPEAPKVSMGDLMTPKGKKAKKLGVKPIAKMAKDSDSDYC